MRGKLAALVAKLIDRNGVLVAPLGAIVLLDFPLDRQTVTVPAGHVVGIEPEHLLRLHNEVLEDLVERVPDVDVAVGVGRSIMQHELCAIACFPPQTVVEPNLFPALQQT